jgi:hypothetical protein
MSAAKESRATAGELAKKTPSEPVVAMAGGFRTIPLTRGHVAIVDDADFESLSEFRWRSSGRYAVCQDGRRRVIHMHRLISQPPEGLCVDHINGNGFDNRRSNLRNCTLAENVRNSRSTGCTGFKGVVYVRSTHKYRAYLAMAGRTYNSACFATAIGAALAYDAMARAHHGAFAGLNFPGMTVDWEWRSGSQPRAARRAGQHFSPTHLQGPPA